MTDLGLANWVAAGFFFFGGASVALWVDLWLRRLKDRAADDARILLRWGDDWVPIIPADCYNIHCWYCVPRVTELIIYLMFEDSIEKPHMYALSNKEGIRWKELQLSERHAIIAIEERQKNSCMYFAVVAESGRSPHARRQQPNVWQDAIHFEEIPDTLVYGENKLGWRERLRARFSRA